MSTSTTHAFFSTFRSTIRRRCRIQWCFCVAVMMAIGGSSNGAAAAAASSRKTSGEQSALLSLKSLHEVVDKAILMDRIFPKRSSDEAAVLEWGHSAILTALDASVAYFGPQTSQAALLEVEAKPILASPIHGMKLKQKKPINDTTNANVSDRIDNDENNRMDNNDSDADVDVDEIEEEAVKILDNADEVHGNLVIMTDSNPLTGVEMARIAQASGAAALVVVHLNEEKPEEIYRLQADPGHEDITIPTVMISLNSAQALTTATVTEDMKEEDIVNHGMPDRVRLYSGGDRPFFEDIETVDPTVYLIHNLLTKAECESLIQQAKNVVAPVHTQSNNDENNDDDSISYDEDDDVLQLTREKWKFRNVQRAMLWQGAFHSPNRKLIEERINQVTAFPLDHFHDWIVDRYEPGESYWLPHDDTAPNGIVPLATITVFLSVPDTSSISSNDNLNDRGSSGNNGGHMVFPVSAEKEKLSSRPIAIRPVQGLAVVCHNVNEQTELDRHSNHAQLPPGDGGTMYIATKFISPAPLNRTRRYILPSVSLVWQWIVSIMGGGSGGTLPYGIVATHAYLVRRFGFETGDNYFEKLCIFIPMLILLCLVQFIIDFIRSSTSLSSSPPSASNSSSSTASSASSSATAGATLSLNSASSHNGTSNKPRNKTDKKKKKN